MALLDMMFFFFNDTATTEIYTLSLHDALPISAAPVRPRRRGPSSAAPPLHSRRLRRPAASPRTRSDRDGSRRSEEHTSELQSRQYLVCRLLLEKKQKKLFRIRMSLNSGRQLLT